MKILFINTLYAPHIGGGAELILQAHVEGLQKRGHEVTVLTAGSEPGLTEDEVNGVRVLRAGLRNIYWHHRSDRPAWWQRTLWHLRDSYNPAMAKVVGDLVRREQPEVVVCHNLAGWSAATWGAVKRSGAPLVQVLHDVYSLCPNSNMFSAGHACASQCGRCKAFRLFHRYLSEHVDAVVGVSRFVLDRHLQYGYFRNARVRRAIHNARDMSPQLRVGSASLEGNVRFGFIGTLSPVKGVDLLLETFSRLNLPNAELWIAGTGKREYSETLRRYESSRVRFLGYSKPGNFFSSIDVLVVPSLWHDTLPGVVFEALAHGVPVLGSMRGGIPEMIEDGTNGFLFDPEDPQQLSELLKRLAENPGEIEVMRPKVIGGARPYIDVGGWLDQYEDLYAEVAEC